MQQRLSFGDEIVDDLVTGRLDYDLLGRRSGLLRLGDREGNLALAFLLLRTFVRGGGRFFDCRRHLGRRGCVGQDRLIGGVTGRRTSSKDQEGQNQGQRSRLHG